MIYLLLYTESEQTPGILLLTFRKRLIVYRGLLYKKALDRFNFGPDIKIWIKTLYTSVNRRIKDFKIKEKDFFLLSQLADDTTVCLALDSSEESLTECIKTLEAFTLIASLKLNKGNTHLVWIGRQIL